MVVKDSEGAALTAAAADELETAEKLETAGVELEGRADEEDRDPFTAAYVWPCVSNVTFPRVCPSQTTVQELASTVLGTDSHMRRSPSYTVKPGSVAFPCWMRLSRKLAASALATYAWTWKMTWMMQWRTENAK